MLKKIISRLFKPASLPTHYPREWVDTPAGLRRVTAAVKAADRVFFDLEADSMHHYYAKICLMQILVGGRCYLVDPLAKVDLEPLLAALAQKPLVGHGTDYDLRMLWQQHGFRPLEVFDTMIAAQLLGRSAFGLAALIRDHFGIDIPKEGQKADWSRRPLGTALLEYAAQDTYFLPSLQRILQDELKAKGRLDWHRESCEALIRATAKVRETEPDSAWRITGSHRFPPRQLAALKAMWEVRERSAQARDLPSFKILPSDILLRFAESVPAEGSPEELPRLPSRLNPDLRDDLLDAFEDALASDRREWPQPLPPAKKPPRSPHPELLNDLKEIRDRIAEPLGLDPSLLAPRAVMTAAAMTGFRDPEDVREAAGWMRWQEALLLEPWMQAAQRYQRKPRP